MKKIVCFILSSFVITSILVGCQINRNNLPQNKETKNQKESISQTINFNADKVIKEDLFFNSIRPFLTTNIPYQTWDNASDIPVEEFMQLYFLNSEFDVENWETIDTDYVFVPQSIVENFIQNSFNVETHYLRTSEHYTKEKSSYKFNYENGSGGAGYPLISNIKIENNKYIITLDYSSYKNDINSNNNMSIIMTFKYDKEKDIYIYIQNKYIS